MNNKVKKIFCLALVLILFLHANYVAFYYSLYTINVNALTEDYCEKVKPCCNAQCYLYKQMNEDNDVSKNKDQKSENRLILSEYVRNESELLPFLSDNNEYFSYKVIITTNDFYFEIEHPPQA